MAMHNSATDSLEELFREMELRTQEDYNIGLYDKLLQNDLDEQQVLLPDGILEEDIPQVYSDLAQAIIKKVKAAEAVFDGYQEDMVPRRSLVDLAAVKRIENQLQERSVYICFLGRYNSGKSTLINALLGIEILPVSDTPETAITLLIQDDDMSSHQSSVRLIHDGRLEANGVENVKKALKSLHSGIRGRSRMSVEEYLLKISFPMIKSSSESDQPRAFILDTPGSNEVGQVELQQVAELNLRTASAYVYIMTYNDIKNREDYEALKTIHRRDEKIFQSERLTIVVTHFDQFYDSNKESSISRKQIKSIVAETIESEIGVKVSLDIIFPLSGVWACKTRICEKDGYNCYYNDVELASLNILRVENSGKSTRQYLDEMEEMGKQMVVQKLEDVSGIVEFEKRLFEVNQRLSEIWKKNILTGCTGFLESAINEMEHMEESITHKLRDWESRVQSASCVVQYHKAMLDSIKRDSPFYDVLKDAFQRDTNYDQQITQMLNNLQDTINSHKQRKKKYGKEDLQTDVDAFTTSAERKIIAFICQRKFIFCQRLLRQHTQRVSEKFGRLRSAATLVVNPDVAPSTIGRLLDENDLSGNDDLTQDMEVFGMDMRAINISDIVKPTFGQRLKQWIPFKRVEIVNEEHILCVRNDREESLKQLHQQLRDQIQDKVLFYFFKAYCNVVTKELDIFTQQQEDANVNLLNDFQDRKKHLASKKKQKENLHNLIKHFRILKQRLQTQGN